MAMKRTPSNEDIREETQNLRKELLCPVCLDYFRTQITLCTNGHNVCGNCRAQLKKCPVCSSDLLETRNFTLENITSILTADCKYRCNKGVRVIDVIMDHEANCNLRPMKCPMQNCASEIPLAIMRAHLNEAHSASLHTGTQRSVTSMKCTGINSDTTWQRAILFSDEIFLHVCQVMNNELYTCVLHVGLEEQTSKFSYLVSIGRRVALYDVCNYKCDLNQIFRSGKCGIFDYARVKRYSEIKNKLNMTVILSLRVSCN
jgi:E3 ubiquitin-protein ligase SIAH1